MEADITMKASLPNKDLITKDLTASQIKAWANPQFYIIILSKCTM
ncbi:hypothetical protein HMPREF1394_01561 [Helicobacter pylori GAM105Ai]|nr:hypothetical protein HMPREF1394_01561 [Helicobacter pylori GAM105Ai]